MALKYTERTTGVSIVTTELNSLADDTAALITTPLSNDASTERELFADFIVAIAEQGSARDAAGTVSLLIVPEVNSTYGDTATLATAGNYVARTADGSAVELVLDAAVTARTMTFANVRLPNANYKVGLLNETGQALAATGNSIFMSGAYSTENSTS